MPDDWLEEQNRKSAEFWKRVDEAPARRTADGMARVTDMRRRGCSDDYISKKLREKE